MCRMLQVHNDDFGTRIQVYRDSHPIVIQPVGFTGVLAVLAAILGFSSTFSCHCLQAEPRLPSHEELLRAETGSLEVELAE